MDALEYMITRNLYNYWCSPCAPEDEKNNYESMKGVKGQVDFGNDIFVVFQSSGGSGPRGTPPSTQIVRIKK